MVTLFLNCALDEFPLALDVTLLIALSDRGSKRDGDMKHEIMEFARNRAITVNGRVDSWAAAAVCPRQLDSTFSLFTLVTFTPV